MNYYAHPSAIVDNVHGVVGDGTKIWAFCHIMDDVVIGANCKIGDQVFIESGVVIGDNVTIKNGVHLYNGLIVEDNVFIGPQAVFTNDLKPRRLSVDHGTKCRKTFLKEGCTIGANATIVCGAVIGAHAMIGAGSVVTKDIEGYSMSYGNPARHKSYICLCGSEMIIYSGNTLELHCTQCNHKAWQDASGEWQVIL